VQVSETGGARQMRDSSWILALSSSFGVSEDLLGRGFFAFLG
jgi:hypothetical protein